MKQFITFLLKGLALLILTMVLLDALYTAIYMQSNSRTKIDFLYNSKDKNYDVVFLVESIFLLVIL